MPFSGLNLLKFDSKHCLRLIAAADAVVADIIAIELPPPLYLCVLNKSSSTRPSSRDPRSK